MNYCHSLLPGTMEIKSTGKRRSEWVHKMNLGKFFIDLRIIKELTIHPRQDYCRFSIVRTNLLHYLKVARHNCRGEGFRTTVLDNSTQSLGSDQTFGQNLSKRSSSILPKQVLSPCRKSKHLIYVLPVSPSHLSFQSLMKKGRSKNNRVLYNKVKFCTRTITKTTYLLSLLFYRQYRKVLREITVLVLF